MYLIIRLLFTYMLNSRAGANNSVQFNSLFLYELFWTELARIQRVIITKVKLSL
jgi:hypothetical protein